MRFKTLNSTYEVDTIRKFIRRLEGTENPTPRQGPDGEWKQYIDIYSLGVGQSAMIVWNVVAEAEGPTLKTTVTSEIKEIDLTGESL